MESKRSAQQVPDLLRFLKRRKINLIFRRVVGVVGIGHVQGIKEHWGKVTEEDIHRIMTIPAQSRTSKVLRFSVRVAFFGGLAYAAYKIVPFQRIVQLVRS